MSLTAWSNSTLSGCCVFFAIGVSYFLWMQDASSPSESAATNARLENEPNKTIPSKPLLILPPLPHFAIPAQPFRHRSRGKRTNRQPPSRHPPLPLQRYFPVLRRRQSRWQNSAAARNASGKAAALCSRHWG